MSFILLVEQTAPETPSANQVVVYPKSDGRVYSKDDAGTERAISASAGATTDNAIARYDGTAGALQNSGITINDSDAIAGATLTAPVFNGSLTGDAIALQAEMETAAAIDSIVTPGRQHFNPKHPKVICRFNGTGTVAIAIESGGAGLIDNGTGDYSVTFPAFSGASALVAVASGGSGDTTDYFITCPFNADFSTTAVRIGAFSGGRALTDLVNINIVISGDL